MSSKLCFIISLICLVVFFVAIEFEYHLLAMIVPFIGIVFLSVGLTIRSENSIKREYAEFSDTSKEKIGMTISEVRRLTSIQTRPIRVPYPKPMP